MTYTADPAAQTLALAVMRFARRLRGRINTPVTYTQYAVLTALAQDGPLTPGQLAVREQVRPPSMSRVIATLEELGFICRTVHPDDGRQAIIALTESGQLLVDGENIGQAWLYDQYDTLTEAERETLTAASTILERMQ